MNERSRKLASLGGPALGVPLEGALDLQIPADLDALLNIRDGFYCFESSLHVFPRRATGQLDLVAWNAPSLWKAEYGIIDLLSHVLFAEDVFGYQFGILPSGTISRFDPETGAIEDFAGDMESWSSMMLTDFELHTGFPLAHQWQERHGPLANGQRLLPKIPFVTGGKFSVENLYACDAVRGMRVRAELARQIRDLPDGTRITYKIVE